LLRSCEGSVLWVGAKPNVPLAGWLKITRLFNFSFSGARESLRLFVLKNVRRGKNKKHRVGNECRLTRCPFVIWSVCCSLVKMVYFYVLVVYQCSECRPTIGYNVRITDMQGRTVLQKHLQQPTTQYILDISTLQKGVYAVACAGTVPIGKVKLIKQ
jgi:hypothetical protein